MEVREVIVHLSDQREISKLENDHPCLIQVFKHFLGLVKAERILPRHQR